MDGKPIRFNLCLSYPIADILTDDAPWHGIGAEARLWPT